MSAPIVTRPALRPEAPPSTSPPRAEVRGGPVPPTLGLAAFLARAGSAMLAGLPARAWIEATVAAAKATTTGWALELTDSGVPDAGHPSGGAAQLRAFLARDTARVLGRDLGIAVDPALLVGLTTCLLVAPSFSPRWHLQGRILGLSAEAGTSLARRATERLRQDLTASGLYDRQRGLPIPPDVTRIAVLHPSGAAGYADVATELVRWQAAGIVRVSRHEAPFEGERAAAQLTAALMAAAAPVDGQRPDLILMVRGGGATAGLQALDRDTIVRTVCRCPVPIVTGLGHAVDRTLVDEVAWHAADTPSKAVARVGRLISAPAARARADAATIERAAASVLGAQDTELTAVHASVCADARQQVGRVQVDLDRMPMALSASRERLHRALDHQGVDTARLWREVRTDAEAHGGERADALIRTLRAIATAARRACATADTGTGLLAAVTRAAAAQVATARARCDGHWHDVGGLARDRLTGTAGTLGDVASLIAMTDLPTQLARGLAVVTDAAGHLIRAPAAARAAGRVTLTLAGGSVAAVVEIRPSATPKGHGT